MPTLGETIRAPVVAARNTKNAAWIKILNSKKKYLHQEELALQLNMELALINHSRDVQNGNSMFNARCTRIPGTVLNGTSIDIKNNAFVTDFVLFAITMLIMEDVQELKKMYILL
jgi:hypothetical protein